MTLIYTGTQQGRFTSNGSPKILVLRQDLDYLWVYNQTVQYAAGAGTGAEFYWQRGFAQGLGTIYTKTAVTGALAVAQIAAASGFYLIDSSLNSPGPSTVVTGILGSAGAFSSPQVLTGNTRGLPVTAVVGANNPAGVVRIFSTVGALQLQGIDFTVANVVNNTSFDLIYMRSIVDANPGAGTFRVIPFDPLFYPTVRIISKIVVATAGTAKAGNPAMAADQALVTLTVTHGYTVGQSIRFIIPTVNATAFGMTELNNVEASIIAIGDTDADGSINTIRLAIDVSGFTAFAWPLTAAGGFTPPQVVPVGEDTAAALAAGVNVLGDATRNTGFIGIQLMAGASSPAGVSGDVIYWVAGKSFSVDN